MVLSVTDAWKQAMSRSGVQPVYRAILTVGPALMFTVEDYTAAVGDTLNFIGVINKYGGGTTTHNLPLSEGTTWHAATSNAATALSIAHAISGTVTTGPNTYVNASRALEVLAYAYNNVVVVIPALPGVAPISGALSDFASISVTFSNASAYSTNYLPPTVSFCSADYAGRAPSELPLIADVVNVRNSMDPMSRQVSIGSVDIVFSEATGAVRRLLSSAPMHNRLVRLQIGAAELAASDFAPVGSYLIDEIIPEPGAITIRGIEPLILASNAQFTANMFCMHPVDAIRQLLPLMGFPYTFFDSNSLDISQPAFADISHWAVARTNWYTLTTGATTSSGPLGLGQGDSGFFPDCNNGISQPTSVKSLIDDLCKICNAGFSVDENGIYAFRRYDSTVSSSRSLGDDDISEFTQLHTLDNQVSVVQIVGEQNAVGNQLSASSQSGMVLATASDYVGSATYANGNITAQSTYTIQSQWLGIPAFLYYDCPSYQFTLTLQPPTLAAFCGTVQSETALRLPAAGPPPAPQPTQSSFATLSPFSTPQRASFLLITDGSNQELIRCTGFSWETGHLLFHGPSGLTNVSPVFLVDVITAADYSGTGIVMPGNVFSPEIGVPVGNVDPSWFPYLSAQYFHGTQGFGMFSVGTFQVQQRDYLGNGAHPQNWHTVGGRWPTAAPRVYDVTIATYTAQAILNRFRLGAPVVRIRVPLSHWDLQIGDFVTLYNDLYIGLFTSAANGGAIFEITGKELAATADSPGVILELTWARDDVTPESASFLGQAGGALSPTPKTSEIITDNSLANITTATSSLVTT